MECEHNLDTATLLQLVLQYLTSALVYIKSCCRHILTVPLYEEYYHQHHHIPPPLSPRSKAAGLLSSPRFCLSPTKLKGTKFSPVGAPTSEMCFHD
jgi:hypothetical protein